MGKEPRRTGERDSSHLSVQMCPYIPLYHRSTFLRHKGPCFHWHIFHILIYIEILLYMLQVNNFKNWWQKKKTTTSSSLSDDIVRKLHIDFKENVQVRSWEMSCKTKDADTVNLKTNEKSFPPAEADVGFIWLFSTNSVWKSQQTSVHNKWGLGLKIGLGGRG